MHGRAAQAALRIAMFVCIQAAVQDLLRAFENSTHNNNPITDANDTTVDANDAAAAAAAAVADTRNAPDDDVVNVDGQGSRRLSLAGLNRTQNNDALPAAGNFDDNRIGRDVRQEEGAAVRHVSSYQRHNQNQSAGNDRTDVASRPTVRRSISQTGARRGRSSSVARNALSAASLGRTAAAHGLDSSQCLHRRSLSPSSSSSYHHQQQRRRRGRDRLPRQTSHQPVVARRRSDLPLTV